MKTLAISLFVIFASFQVFAGVNHACVDYLCEDKNACYNQEEQTFEKIVLACTDSSFRCVKTLCEDYGSCELFATAQHIATTCKNVDGGCVQLGCDKIGCDLMRDAEFVASSCKAQIDNACLKRACERANCGLRAEWLASVERCLE